MKLAQSLMKSPFARSGRDVQADPIGSRVGRCSRIRRGGRWGCCPRAEPAVDLPVGVAALTAVGRALGIGTAAGRPAGEPLLSAAVARSGTSRPCRNRLDGMEGNR